MKVSAERIENSQVILNIEMEPEEVEDSLEAAYHRLVKKSTVPGFRKGKAPRVMLERHIGKPALLEDALGYLLPKAYKQAIEEQEIDAIAQPKIEITQEEPLIFKATVPVRPTVELGDYRSIRLEHELEQVTEEQINAAMEQIRQQRAIWEPVNRPVHFDDLVTIDVDGNTEEKSFLSEKEAQFYVARDMPIPVPGFSEQLKGMKKGKEKEFTLSFPPDYRNSELAGKECSFKVSVTEIKEKRLPELDDEFAKSIGEGYETLDSLREKVIANLTARAEERAKARFREKVIETTVNLAQLEYPPILVEQEIDQLLNEQAQRFQGGRRGLEDYLKSTKKTEEGLREELHPVAVERVESSLVLSKVTEEEKIEVSDSEVDAELETMAQDVGEKAKELQEFFALPAARNSLERSLAARKTIEYLLRIARGEAEEQEMVVLPQSPDEEHSP